MIQNPKHYKQLLMWLLYSVLADRHTAANTEFYGWSCQRHSH